MPTLRSLSMPCLSPLSPLLAAAACCLGLLVQGCATPDATSAAAVSTSKTGTRGDAGAKTPAPAAGTERRDPLIGASGSAGQAALAAGIDAYNRGEFNLAIKRLGAPEIAASDAALQVTALKYTAFSYCVTKRQVKCRQQFVNAFRLDPHFELAPGEKGHPLWGPAFERAKKSVHASSKK